MFKNPSLHSRVETGASLFPRCLFQVRFSDNSYCRWFRYLPPLATTDDALLVTKLGKQELRAWGRRIAFAPSMLTDTGGTVQNAWKGAGDTCTGNASFVWFHVCMSCT